MAETEHGFRRLMRALALLVAVLLGALVPGCGQDGGGDSAKKGERPKQLVQTSTSEGPAQGPATLQRGAAYDSSGSDQGAAASRDNSARSEKGSLHSKDARSEKGSAESGSSSPPSQGNSAAPPSSRVPRGGEVPHQEVLEPSTIESLQGPVVEQTRLMCKRLGAEGLRRQFDIKSEDLTDIAREVATRSYGANFREATFQACLSGLRDGH